MLIPVVPGVNASAVSAALPEILLPTITLSFKLTGGAGAGAQAWLCIVTPGRPLSMIRLPITTFPALVVPGNGAKMPTPAPAPGSASPLCDEIFSGIVFEVIPNGSVAEGITDVAGPCEASVMPQSNELSCT